MSLAEPVCSFSRRSVRSSTSWASEPRRIGSGSASTGSGLRTCSISHLTGQVANVSRPRADSRSRAASAAQHRGIGRRGERRRVGRVAGRGLRAAQLVRRRRLGRRPRDLGQQPAAAVLPQLVGEQRADVVQERRRLLRPALLVAGAEGEEQRLLRPRDARVEQRCARAGASPRGAAGRARTRPPAPPARRRPGTARAAAAAAARPPAGRTARSPGSAARGSPAGRRAARPACRPRPAPSRAPRPRQRLEQLLRLAGQRRVVLARAGSAP